MEFYSVHENVCLWGQSQKKTSPVGAGPEDRSASTAKTQGPIWTVVRCGEKTPGGSRPSPPCPSTRQKWRSIPAMGRGKCIVLHHEAEEDTCRHRYLEGACSRGGSRQSDRVTGVSLIYAIRDKPPGSQLFPWIEIWRNRKVGVF